MTQKSDYSTFVEVRFFSSKDEDKPWHTVPVSAYLPSFLSPDGQYDNIEKRLSYYLKDPNISKLRWNIQGSEDGFWMKL
ncbi:MAG: hypothetical protein HRT90_10170 [Candidatus Margulisbacteria bacterium]|nr:hypothetical protein [Candidatus Margulisiibacteriota bacterium]